MWYDSVLKPQVTIVVVIVCSYIVTLSQLDHSSVLHKHIAEIAGWDSRSLPSLLYPKSVRKAQAAHACLFISPSFYFVGCDGRSGGYSPLSSQLQCVCYQLERQAGPR